MDTTTLSTTPVLSKAPPQLPAPFDASPSSLVEDARAIAERTVAVWNQIAASVQASEATFENTIQPIIDDENLKHTQFRILKFYSSTSSSKELRDASHSATTLLNDADVDLYSRIDMFLLVEVVVRKFKDSTDHSFKSNVDEQSRCYTEKLHRTLYQNGCAIADAETRHMFEKCQKRVDELTRRCTSNFNEDQSGIWLGVDELDGVAPEFVEQLKKSGEGEEQQGKVWLKTKLPHPTIVLRYAKKEATRQKVYYAIKNRLPQNVDLFRELVLCRDEVARLLGYPNYLAYKIADKMMQKPDVVINILSELRSRMEPQSIKLSKDVLKLKVQEATSRGVQESEEETKVFFWDESFYSSIQDESGQRVDANVSEYFELHNTIARLLELFRHIFGTRFERITSPQQLEESLGHGKSLIWHEDVEMYAVWDDADSDAFLGYAYLDLYPRDGKTGRGGNYPLQWGFSRSDGSRFYPSCALVMNYSKPVDSKPSLLSMGEARHLFHELGHLHHTLCTKAKHAGLCSIDKDFIETPSLMFEQFFRHQRLVQDLSYHYSYISPALRAVWLESQGTNEAMMKRPSLHLENKDVAILVSNNPNNLIGRETQNLFYALYDVLVHSPATHEELEQANLAEMFNKLQSEVKAMHGGEELGDGWDWSHGESVFRTIVGGYGAGYYTYVLGKVFALDMWQCEFETDAMSKEAGKRFREMVFQVGGSQPEMKTLTSYLGREPSTAPYCEWLGI